MSRSGLILPISVLTAGMLFGCTGGWTVDSVDLETQVGSRVVLDLISHDTFEPDESYDEYKISMSGCEVTSEGLPDNAMFDGQFLVWTPTQTQVGYHAAHLNYGVGCHGQIPVVEDVIRFQVDSRGAASGAKDAPLGMNSSVPEDVSDTLYVHDLE